MEDLTFTFVSHLGRGGYGQVDKYLLSTGTYVAVKFFKPTDDGLDTSTVRELHTLENLKGCANIVQVEGINAYIEYGLTNVNATLTYHNGDLYNFYTTVPFLERLKYLDVFINQSLNAFYHMNLKGIIHRDIKPDNILVDYEYDSVTNMLLYEPSFYVGDFGLALQLPCNVLYRKREKSFDVGSLWYKAPELLFYQTQYSHKIDLWALGITIIEYLIGKRLLNGTDVDDMVSRIFSMLHQPIIESEVTTLVHDSIDVRKVLEEKMSAFHYDMLSDNTITLIESLLNINPDDRPQITDLIIENNTPCKSYKILGRGIILSGPISVNMYYMLVVWLIDIASNFKLTTDTIISGIDILERYLANFGNDIELNNLQLVGMTCLYLSSKMLEIHYNDINDYIYISDHTYTSNQIKEMELTIIKRLNYIIITCDVDNYSYYVREYNLPLKYKYIKLGKLYAYLKRKDLYAGNMSYTEILSILEHDVMPYD